MDLPIVPATDDTGALGVILVREMVHRLGHIFRETTTRDYGIDGQIEILALRDGAKYATSKLLAVQIKCGKKYIRSSGDNIPFYCNATHANYWQEHSLPVILILCDPETRICYWEWINQNTITPTPKGARILVPKNKTLDKAGGYLENIAKKRGATSAESCTFILPLNDCYAIDLPDEEIAVLCSEIYLAYSRKYDVQIDIGFTVEDFFLNALNDIPDNGDLTIEQRKKRNEYEQAMDWFTVNRAALALGVKLLFTEGLDRLGSLNLGSWKPAATTLKAFVDYQVYQRTGHHRPGGMALDAFPGNGINTPVARIYLDATQELGLYKKLVFNNRASEDITLPDDPFWFHKAILLELGFDIIYERALPAVISALVSYLRRNEMSAETFFATPAGDLLVWQVGLA